MCNNTTAYMYIVSEYFTRKSECVSHKANVTHLTFRGLPVAAFFKQAMHPRIYQCLLVLNIWLLVMESCACKTFKSKRFPNGTVACANDNPTTVFTLNQTHPRGECSESCTVYGMQYAWRCSQDDCCTNYNYREDLGKCEMFYYTSVRIVQKEVGGSKFFF